MNAEFALGLLGQGASGCDRLSLRGMDRGGAAVAFAYDGPRITAANYVVVFGHVKKRAKHRAFDAPVRLTRLQPSGGLSFPNVRQPLELRRPLGRRYPETKPPMVRAIGGFLPKYELRRAGKLG